MIRQFLRFGLVGAANTLLDLGVFTLLLTIFPTRDVGLALFYNSLAFIVAAANSFFWNKYWTFRKDRHIKWREIAAFAFVTLSGMTLNNVILFLLSLLFGSALFLNGMFALGGKGVAIAMTMMISFFGMRLLVFGEHKERPREPMFHLVIPHEPYAYALSVVLPAYNEEENIAGTVRHVLAHLPRLVSDFEIIVVNDGSKDRTQEIVEALVAQDARVRLINHAKNQGCGAALRTGFAAATKEFVFYMDSDGQFDIIDLARLLPHLSEYDGVFGYRIDRKDPPIRKLNAWGWNCIVRFVFGLRIRDVDAAFKIFRSDYFQKVRLENQGAMLLTELVYKFAREGYSYTEVGVRHFPRERGNPTGANLRVILRAFTELFLCARKWSHEEYRY